MLTYGRAVASSHVARACLSYGRPCRAVCEQHRALWHAGRRRFGRGRDDDAERRATATGLTRRFEGDHSRRVSAGNALREEASQGGLSGDHWREIIFSIISFGGGHCGEHPGQSRFVASTALLLWHRSTDRGIGARAGTAAAGMLLQVDTSGRCYLSLLLERVVRTRAMEATHTLRTTTGWCGIFTWHVEWEHWVGFLLVCIRASRPLEAAVASSPKSVNTL